MLSIIREFCKISRALPEMCLKFQIKEGGDVVRVRARLSDTGSRSSVDSCHSPTTTEADAPLRSSSSGNVRQLLHKFEGNHFRLISEDSA